MVLSEFYRNYQLPWELDPEEQRLLRGLLLGGLILLVLLGVVVPLVKLPPLSETAAEAVPERLARLMVQEKPKPPPPVEQPKPKPEAKPVPALKPVEAPKPVDRVAQARDKAQQSGLLKFKDELADLREVADMNALDQTQNLQGAVGQDSHAERSLIASKVGAGSGGITSANASRGFGSGAGSLSGHQTTAVSSRIAAVASSAGVAHGSSGKLSRSREEIELAFDTIKGAINALYQRALRDTPDMQGKVVLEFTIAPTGEVTECHVVSSDLNNPDLEHKIAARVRLLHFQARDVAVMTTTKPIELVPMT